MRLTNAHRETYINAIAKHLPVIAEFDMQSQFDDPVRKAAESILPDEVRSFAKAYPRYVERHSHNLKYLTEEQKSLFIRRPYAMQCSYIVADSDDVREKQKGVRNKAAAKAFAEFDQWCQDKRDRAALLDRLRDITRACGTDKTLRELLPEFAQFVPEEGPRLKFLPVSAGNAVIADLVKAGLKLPNIKEAA